MAGIQNFRSSLGGFNREDVVHYIEYMNNQHNAEREQLNTQLQLAREELAEAKAQDSSELQAQLDAANETIADLEAQLSAALARCAELETVAPAAEEAPATTAEDELEAYRRAERAERMARDRATQIYNQANAALADATITVETVSDQLAAITDQLSEQSQAAKQKLQEAIAAMYAICPEEE